MRLGRTQTWGWSDALEASGETDASLRRKLERGQIELPTTEGGRTQVTLRDIAVLRVSRHLCDLGLEAKRAFGLAKLAVSELFKGEANDQLLYLVMLRSALGPGGVRPLRVDPTKPDDLRELLLVVSDPTNVIVPIQWLVRDAFYSLPHLPDDVAKWLRAVSDMIERVGKSASEVD